MTKHNCGARHVYKIDGDADRAVYGCRHCGERFEAASDAA